MQVAVAGGYDAQQRVVLSNDVLITDERAHQLRSLDPRLFLGIKECQPRERRRALRWIDHRDEQAIDNPENLAVNLAVGLYELRGSHHQLFDATAPAGDSCQKLFGPGKLFSDRGR